MATQSNAVSQYNKPVLVGVGIMLTVVAIIVVGLRFYARRRSRAEVGIDDWCILFALVLCIAGGVIEILAAEIGGMGEHQRLGPNGELTHTSELTNYEKCRYSNEIITTLNLGVIKFSVLLFYRRLFTIRRFKIISGISMGVLAAWTVSFTSAMAAQCTPPRSFWEKFEIDYEPGCIQVQKMYQGLAFSDIVLDVLVLALPIPFVLMLNMPWKKKIAVVDVLLLGTVVIGSGIARVISFTEVVNFTNRDPEAFFYDTLWYTAGPLFWIFAENAVAIVGASLPTLAPLWNRQRLPESKGGSLRSYFSKLSKGSDQRTLDHELQPRNVVNPEHGSTRNLVSTGAATDIHAKTIASEERPAEGIQVETTFSTGPSE